MPPLKFPSKKSVQEFVREIGILVRILPPKFSPTVFVAEIRHIPFRYLAQWHPQCTALQYATRLSWPSQTYSHMANATKFNYPQTRLVRAPA